eukprot:9020084-Pyramimonas_sp.AAC.1
MPRSKQTAMDVLNDSGLRDPAHRHRRGRQICRPLARETDNCAPHWLGDGHVLQPGVAQAAHVEATLQVLCAPEQDLP